MFRNITLSLLMAFALWGCETEVEFKGEYMEPQLVLYSVVTAGEPVVVHLSNSVFILDEATSEKQTGAEVELYVNGSFVERLAEYDYEEVVTEVYGDYVYTETIRHQYYQSSHTCSSGDQVEIRVRCKGFEGEVSGKTTIPQDPILGNLSATISPSEEDEYGGRSVTKGNVYCPLTNEAGSANYYWMHGYVVAKYAYEDYYSGKIIEYYQNTGLGFENDMVFTGVDANGIFDDLLGSSGGDEYVVFDDSLIDGVEEYPLTMSYGFFAEESIEEPVFNVECWQIDDNLYKYLRSLELADGEGILSEPVQIHSNIEGGIGVVGSRSKLVSRTLLFSEAKR